MYLLLIGIKIYSFSSKFTPRVHLDRDSKVEYPCTTCMSLVKKKQVKQKNLFGDGILTCNYLQKIDKIVNLTSGMIVRVISITIKKKLLKKEKKLTSYRNQLEYRLGIRRVATCQYLHP